MMTQRAVEVWLVHADNGGSFGPIRTSIEAACMSKGWGLNLRPVSRSRSFEGRPLAPMKNQDAANLYRQIHRCRVGVWQLGDVHVPITPQPRPTTNDYIPLRRFISHKAFHCRVQLQEIDRQLKSSLSDFEGWLQQILCDGEGDPRCLPLHVFRTGFNVDDLATDMGRSRFADIHGPQSSRLDDNQLRWNRPTGPYHGQEVLSVAGRNLARGFHWDVSSQEKRRRITTTSETWEIGSKGYVNVYPDQHIRSGRLATRKTKAR